VRIGITSLFSFRPHVEHMAYLSAVLEGSGHEIHGFSCDAGVEHCHSRELRGHSSRLQCAACVAGGIRTFEVPRVWSVHRRFRSSLDESRLARITLSSVATRLRTEPGSDLETPEFRTIQAKLYDSVSTVYGNARHWISERGLDAVFLFNGRMDLTAAVAAACEDSGIPYVSVERTWFGHGLMLIPNQNCLGLREIQRLSREFRDRPLLPEQACYAAQVAANRFRQKNTLEWRLYNANAVPVEWPATSAARRVLILPSSKNEVEGHPDYQTPWPDHTQPMEQVLERLHAKPEGCVVRCHPNWAEHIGINTGWRSERHYTEWGRKLGMTVIGSAQKANTYALMEQADAILVNSGSVGVEAGLRGKPVVCIGHAPYEHAGFSVHVVDNGSFGLLDGLEKHDVERSIRHALRYVYTHGRRFPQFVDFVRAVTTMEYEYFEGADPGRLEQMCRAGALQPDDPRFATDVGFESEIVQRVRRAEWDALGQWQEPLTSAPRMNVKRRIGFRWIERARARLPRGDI
jgi:hypothetical protein